MTCITGVSGSGKSTLVNDTLFRIATRELNRTNINPAPYGTIKGLEQFDKVVDIDQGKNISEALEMTVEVEMHFLPDIYVMCDVCRGKRYNRETLDILYKGKNICEALEMTVEEARVFFDAVPVIARKLQTLLDVGLSYIRLGQNATTLSGGEAQRVKLSRELSKRDTGQTLYILDEPTTGLHFHDIKQLLHVLHRLRDHGNTVVVIEHNLDVIKTADWIIDLGPEGGDGGGRIVTSGTPEEVARHKTSYTGKFLKPVLRKHVKGTVRSERKGVR
ncbi:MAG: hypothetical protein A3J35_05425 [Gammaproteobacteria bacterium RIFCSPLOWO2_02_FULL_52_10]|nr:MAG: hypothetical protein A3J35_05425 [Gammaproteobacteria bacterium RIFCSPLOWO2_02_FULL_52_10]